MGNHQKSPIARARNELFSHVIRCDVLDAEMSDRETWLEETMQYMAHRYPDMSDLQLAQLEMIGSRFIKPAIPHGEETTAVNRDEWEDDAHRKELAETEAAESPEEELAGAPAA